MTDQESVVYGYIKGGSAIAPSELSTHIATNKKAIGALPSSEHWPLLVRDMFAVPRLQTQANSGIAHVMHFGMSYCGIEYEWPRWLKTFESLLQQMYWQSAVVHLQTELSGIHTFLWESIDPVHQPGSGSFHARCEWHHELGLV
ncbi:MAG: hypothetical protein KTR20_12350 [Cellvibrionaceae bacterium]|nr:hypothetical protein [Cellvibrionaceae bacterium]